MRVIILDDHTIFSEGLAAILENNNAATIAGIFSNPYTFLEQYNDIVFDLLITDISMPEMNGIELIKIVNKASPSLKILVLTLHTDSLTLKRALKSNVQGIMLKTTNKDILLECIKSLESGNKYFCHEIGKILIECEQQDSSNSIHNIILSPREKEILELIAKGLTNNEIADIIYLSIYTVNTYRKSLLKKFRVKNTAELIRSALEMAII